MTDRSALLDTLIWAAGGDRRPAFEDIDESDLRHALLRHRLDTRMLFRARHEGLDLPPGLLAELEERHARYLGLVTEQIETFAQLRRELADRSPGAGVLPIKGFGLYALTGQEEHIRWSWDVDVIGSDEPSVVEAAKAITGEGFHFHGEDHPYVYAHMDGIEVHSRYLVTSIAKDSVPESFDPRLNPGVMHVGQPFVSTPITYDDIAANLAADPKVDFPVPSAEMALLIRCSHIYVGFAIETRPFPWATVRLEELCQVRELVALPAFDAVRFRALIDQFDGRVVVDFARLMCRELLGSDPFVEAGTAEVVGSDVPAWFPQNLWWDGTSAGFPVRLAWTPEDLIVRSPDWPDLVDELGGWPTDVSDRQASLSTRAGVRDAAARYVEHGFRGGLDFADVHFTLTDEGLRTVVVLPSTPDDQMSAIGIASGESRVELFFKPQEGEAQFSNYSFRKEVGPQMSSSARVEGATHVLEIALPWESLGYAQVPEPGDELRIMVRARQQVRPWNDVVGGVVVPVLLRC